MAALAGLAQFPLGLWSDRWQWRKPFLLVSLGVLAVATALLPAARNLIVLGLLVILFAENGICRAVVESLSGAEAATLAKPGEVGAALVVICVPETLRPVPQAVEDVSIST